MVEFTVTDFYRDNYFDDVYFDPGVSLKVDRGKHLLTLQAAKGFLCCSLWPKSLRDPHLWRQDPHGHPKMSGAVQSPEPLLVPAL